MTTRAILKGVTITSGLGVGAIYYYKADEIEKKFGKLSIEQKNKCYCDS